MAASQVRRVPWHSGEEEMHKLTHVPHGINPSSAFLSPFAAGYLQTAPLVALGSLDAAGRPWTTLWAGEPGFVRPVAGSAIHIRAVVDQMHDPLVPLLFGRSGDGEVIRPDGEGKMVSGLAIDLDNRDRVKLFGRMAAGSLKAIQDDEDISDDEHSASFSNNPVAEVQLVVRISESLGNCPKYLNRKTITLHKPNPHLLSASTHLPPPALALLSKADLFFISSAHGTESMDTNHRGGPPGFLRVMANNPKETTLVWPEYSGNRLYQTLGNLHTTPLAGLAIPDFRTGDVLYVTGRTKILIGAEASAIMPHCNLAVSLTLTSARFVASSLAFRGTEGEFSPYNPPIRYLSSERPSSSTLASPSSNSTTTLKARLISTNFLTPTIARFTFNLSSALPSNAKLPTWRPGQHIALSFAAALDRGYSHMRDSDPTSLNDDFIRTFTVSSAPSTDGVFEITARKVGRVTRWLFEQGELREHSGSRDACPEVELPVQGFGGDFSIRMPETAEDTAATSTKVDIIPFIAGGVGITPLLAHLQIQPPTLDPSRLRLFWTVNVADLGLVVDTFERFPSIKSQTTLFITGNESVVVEGSQKILEKMTIAAGRTTAGKGMGLKWGEGGHVRIENRRIEAHDLLDDEEVQGVRQWYICAGPGLRRSILGWLLGGDELRVDGDDGGDTKSDMAGEEMGKRKINREGKRNVVYEDFGY